MAVHAVTVLLTKLLPSVAHCVSSLTPNYTPSHFEILKYYVFHKQVAKLIKLLLKINMNDNLVSLIRSI